jgi:hypothetical protein
MIGGTANVSSKEMPMDDALPAEHVARRFLENERLYQQRPFDEFTVERLKQVILRARADGAKEYVANSSSRKEPKE